MLLATVSWNRVVSWITMPICERRVRTWTSRMSWPSTRIARLDVPEAGQQVHQRRLAAAVGADQGDGLAVADFQVSPLKDRSRGRCS